MIKSMFQDRFSAISYRKEKIDLRYKSSMYILPHRNRRLPILNKRIACNMFLVALVPNTKGSAFLYGKIRIPKICANLPTYDQLFPK